ncbi:thiamine phosphate synthase [Rhizobium leguminosarum]|nr:thiamine phosphate synthase [Rhizobium leguminosarum]MBY5559188.1 thiamine phosphate synthase [Rhizobium leguminosarum]
MPDISGVPFFINDQLLAMGLEPGVHLGDLGSL